MPRTARRISESSIYHVMNRGEGRQIIFEDNADRYFFMAKIRNLLDEADGKLIAWCLMDNHFHLLIMASIEDLERIMHRLQTSYAGYYNRVHGHDGVLFANRFKSEPVEDDKYLMVVVRYIHENPIKAGLCNTLRYQWSSYIEYCGRRGYADVAFVLEVFGGLDAFCEFHDRNHEEESCLDIGKPPSLQMSDEMARNVADQALGVGVLVTLKAKDRRSRDKALAVLKDNGLGVRQIQRLTGISLCVISRAGK